MCIRDRVTAYTISETALKEYKDKAVEVVGPKKEQAIRDAVAKEQLEKANVCLLYTSACNTRSGRRLTCLWTL